MNENYGHCNIEEGATLVLMVEVLGQLREKKTKLKTKS